MVQYASGSIKFSGLGSDTDFQALIDKLYTVESRQANQLLKWKADWQQRLEAFKQVRSEMLNLQTSLMSMGSMNKFLAKTCTSSEEKYVTAIANADALNGMYTIDVSQLAEQYSWSRNTNIYDKNDVICDDDAGGIFEYRYAGKTRKLVIPKGTTLQGLQNIINNDSQNPGVKVQLVTGQDGIIFQLQGKDTGSSNILVISNTTNLTCFGGNINLTEEKYKEEQNSMTLLKTTFASDDGEDIINPSATEYKTFVFTVDGKRKSISVPPQAKLKDLMKEINDWGAANIAGCKPRTGPPADGTGGNGENLAKLVFNGTDYNFVLSKRETYHGAGSYNDELLNVMDTNFSSKTASLFDSGPDRQYTVYVFKPDDDTSYPVTVTMSAGETLEDLANRLNSSGLLGLNSSARVMEEPAGSGYRLSVPPAATDDMWGMVLSQSFSSDQALIKNTDLTQAKTLTIRLCNSESSPQSNEVLKITMAAGAEYTVRDFINTINEGLGNKGKARLEADGSNFKVVIDTYTTTPRVTIEEGTLDTFKYELPKESSGLWQIQQGKNAHIKVNGWPSGDEVLEVASNNIAAGAVVDGLALTLRGTGEAVITVANDTEKITENVETFVQSINNLRTLLQSLTTWDEEKTQLDPDYADSQFEMQRGSVLTGNYGIQMLSSQFKTAVASSSLGCNHLVTDAAGVVTGDIFSSLSQIGITTNATKGHANYGLLEINYIDGKGGQKSLSTALTENPEAVARMFAVYGEGSSNNQELFQYHSHIDGIAKPGKYDVSYTVELDGNGDPYIATAFINGQPAKISGWQILLTEPNGDPARSIALDIYNMATGVEHKGTVSIKQGKINELLEMMDGTDGILGSGGTLKNLEKNYQTIIDNIEKKIKQEDDRLVKWWQTMDLKFSRLETVLSKYNSINDSLKTQIAQLGQSSST